jgi:hypothetical protein
MDEERTDFESGVGRRRILQGAMGFAGAGVIGSRRATAWNVSNETSNGPSADPLRLVTGRGTELRIERDPFRIALVEVGGPEGQELVGTVAGREGSPFRPPGLDGPMPVEPAGEVGGYPAMGFLVGASEGQGFPATFFTGNRLAGGSGERSSRSSVSPTPTASRGPVPDRRWN